MLRVEFLHANGFPAPCYRQLFAKLHDCEVSFVECLGESQNPWPASWQLIAAEVVARLSPQRPCVGIGHSLGGVVLLEAAAQQPQAFEQLILLDPPLFHPVKRGALWCLKQVGLMEAVTPAAKTKRRRACFASREDALKNFRGKGFFRNFPLSVLEDYVNEGLVEQGEGVCLRVSPAFEFHLYQTFPLRANPLWQELRGEIIYAAQNGVSQTMDRQWAQRFLPHFRQQVFAGGHMFPLEQPEQTAQLLNQVMGVGDAALPEVGKHN